MNGLQRVQVFGLKIPPVGTPKAKRRYLVRWRVDGRDRMRSFKTRAEADRFRSRLLVEVTAGTAFDRESGLPVPWAVPDQAPTWWSWSREWLGLKWPQWSGHSR